MASRNLFSFSLLHQRFANRVCYTHTTNLNYNFPLLQQTLWTNSNFSPCSTQKSSQLD